MALDDLSTIRTPKQPQADRLRAWYPYYAGYRPEFVADVIRAAELAPGSKVLDPWNGSGTTTTVASGLGHRAFGLDVNPALTIIAKGRALDLNIADSLAPLGNDILQHAIENAGSIDEDDPLLEWLVDDTAVRIRAIEASIRTILVSDTGALEVDKVSSIAAFFYCALFSTTRSRLQKFLSSNPTWIVRPKHKLDRAKAEWIDINPTFKEAVKLLQGKLGHGWTADVGQEPTIRTQGSESPSLDAGSVDIVITSPPYCTRLDYVIATLPELAVLGLRRDTVRSLRQETMGAPTVRGYESDVEGLNPYGRELLDEISQHASKASSTYYAKYFSKYFFSLDQSIGRILDVLKPAASACLVVQSSFYKDIFVNLQQFVIEAGTVRGASCMVRDFPVSWTFSHVRPNMSLHDPSKMGETLVVLTKPS